MKRLRKEAPTPVEPPGPAGEEAAAPGFARPFGPPVRSGPVGADEARPVIASDLSIVPDTFSVILSPVTRVMLGLTEERGLYWKEHKVELTEKLQRLLEGIPPAVLKQIEDWVSFYRKYFDINIEPDEIKIPKRREGFDRLIVVAAELGPQRIFDTMSEHDMHIYKYHNHLDSNVVSARRGSKPYAVWVRDRVESDIEWQLKSVQVLQGEVEIISLEEHMLDCFRYYKDTGRFLNGDTITVCGGSRLRRDPDSIPSVDLRRDIIAVAEVGIKEEQPNSRIREVVI